MTHTFFDLKEAYVELFRRAYHLGRAGSLQFECEAIIDQLRENLEEQLKYVGLIQDWLVLLRPHWEGTENIFDAGDNANEAGDLQGDLTCILAYERVLPVMPSLTRPPDYPRTRNPDS